MPTTSDLTLGAPACVTSVTTLRTILHDSIAPFSSDANRGQLNVPRSDAHRAGSSRVDIGSLSDVMTEPMTWVLEFLNHCSTQCETLSLRGLTRNHSIHPRKRIRRFRTVYQLRVPEGSNGWNRGGDSAPNWALRLCGTRRLWLFSCLLCEHAEWLGIVIARWANVPVRLLRQIDAPTPE